jgi:hypothetical protein
MSWYRKFFFICLGLVTALIAIAASYPQGGAHALQIKYLPHAGGARHADRLRII